MVEHHTQLRARHLSRSEEGSEAEVDHGPRGGGRVALTHVNGERTEGAAAAMYSPHELRVESRLAIPQLAAWLACGLGQAAPH